MTSLPATFHDLTLGVERGPCARLAPQAALPVLIEPDPMPSLDLSRLGAEQWEDLAPVTQAPRVMDLAAYAHAGIPGAPAHSWARVEVVRRLAVAAASLPAGYGLAVFDAWRPIEVQQALFEAAYADPTLPEGFVTPPSVDPATPPPHLTGGTVDVTLTHTGQPLALGTDFDDFTPAAHADAFEHRPGPVREHRRLLFHAMSLAGFIVISCEWWHFEYGTRRWAALTGRHPLYPAALGADLTALAQREAS